MAAEPQNLTVLSPDVDATTLPSGENARALTPPEWPLSMQRVTSVSESWSLTVSSVDANGTTLPSSELLVVIGTGRSVAEVGFWGGGKQ